MRRNLEIKAWILLILFLTEIFSPMHLMALGSGPSQPEMAAFTPAGTTEMVDPFTGDFTYNIPLMDIEGYPVNIAYNSGVTMEQEASWVGLGWNLNVGTINRSVRGIPDDFKGSDDGIHTITSIKPMKIVKVGGAVVGEVFGMGKGSAGLSFIHNNYKGFGLARSASVGAELGPLNANVGIEVNTLDGTSVNSSLGLAVTTNQSKYGALNFGASVSGGFNTRTGQTMLSFGTTAGYKSPTKFLSNNPFKGMGSFSTDLMSTSTSLLPIGMDTYTPYPSLKMTTSTVDFSGTIGGAAMGLHVGGRIHGSITSQSLLDGDVSTPAYGYLYMEEANNSSLVDFNRDKQINLNQTINNLPPTNFTYDVYSVSGQGVSGMFRPFRNDIGILSDPSYEITSNSSNSFGAEYGGGLYFHGGLTYNTVNVESSYGKWNDNNRFSEFKNRGIEEKVYFKSAGDKSESDIDFFESIGAFDAYAYQLNGESLYGSLKSRDGSVLGGLVETKSQGGRSARSKVFNYLTAKEASTFAFEKIKDCSGSFYEGEYEEKIIERVNEEDRKEHHISEITQINPDGERYVYGIPAYNLLKKEVTYNTEDSPDSRNRINHNSDASTSNKEGVDHYYSATKTPPYAHSYLLTAKLSSDYQDVTGDGVSPDDIGNAYSFKYNRTSSNYQWRTPYDRNTFMEGFKSNNLDQKGSYTYGKKEIWYLNSIHSKNQVAEFYTSERDDALGVEGETGGKELGSDGRLHQLDSIVLYDKFDRLENKEKAIPLKKIAFTYDYSLCEGVENHVIGLGKLTLKKIEISYGRGEYGKESPYEFSYSDFNPNYNPTHVDRWGNYKDDAYNPDPIMKNWEYPYTLSLHEMDTVLTQQMDSLQDVWASAWSLTNILTPEGGTIHIEYEADDYAYVQHKKAMQMFPIIGGGRTIDYDEEYPSNYYNLYNSDYLYFKRPEVISTELTTKELSRLFLGDKEKLDEMYFKFLTNIDHNKLEHVSGYTSALEVGYCSNKEYLYIKLPDVNPNPISKTAWGFFRHNLFEVLYQQPNIKNTGVESVVRGIRANINDIRQMFSGVESHLKSRNIAKVFTPLKSFVRLFNPVQSKKGGGSRVKRIFINDNWKDLSGEGENSIYGQEYFYTTEENQREISSGVASYEPMIGGDENPFRVPVWYTASQAQGHIPAIDAFQEKPFGETFFPSASVGYSRVVVRNIHHMVGKTSNSITEHKFYTAKDFPVIVDETPIQLVNQPADKTKITFPFVNNTSRSVLSASQGYSIVLNDMHGKPLSTNKFLLIEEDESSSKIKKLIEGTKYNYHASKSKNGYQLENEVEVLTTNGRIEDKLLGVEVDLSIENRRTYEKSTSTGTHANLDIFPIPFPFAPIPIFIPNASHNRLIDIKESKYQVLTKVIQQYGLISSVEHYTDQYKQTIYNKLYDGNSGKVLLTETKDEYNKNEFQFDFPAYMVQGTELLGPAYQTIGLEMDIYPKVKDAQCNPNNSAFSPEMPEHLNEGDEVIVTYYGDSTNRAWVVLDSNNTYNAPILSCDTDTVATPFVPKYRRLLTKFGRQDISDYGDSIVPFINGRFKKQFGQILEDVKIYHLKEDFAHLYDSLYLNSDELFSYFDAYPESFCKISAYPSNDALFYGAGTKINHLYHSDKCAKRLDFFKVFSGTLFSNANFLKLKDLAEYFEVSDTANLGVIFDLSDTLSAKIELLEAYEYRDSVVYGCQKSLNGNNRICEETHKRDTSIYRVQYNSCSVFNDGIEMYYDHFEPIDDEAWHYENYTDPIVSGRLKGGLRLALRTGVCDPVVDTGEWSCLTVKNRKSTKASFRIEDKESFHPYFERNSDYVTNPNGALFKDEQLYLIEYNIRKNNSGTIEKHYYIEIGRAAESIPWRDNANQSPFCLKEDSLWAALRDSSIVATIDTTPCENNFRLMNRAGSYLSVKDAKSVRIIRPAYRNQLDANMGKLITSESPVKSGFQGDRRVGDDNYFKGFVDNTIYLQANAQTLSDNTNVISSYPQTSNPFVSGQSGTYRVDSSMFYMGSRQQNNNINTTDDGYLEDLPSLWAKLPCNESLLQPDYDGEDASGWKFREQVSKYNAYGQPIESISNLGIASALITNRKGQVIAKGGNSKHNYMGYDGFENYYSFGKSNALSKNGFSVQQSDPSSTTKELINTGDEKYTSVKYGTKSIVKGVAHTGTYSMFVNRETNTPSSISIQYDENELNYLEQLSFLRGDPPAQKDTLINDVNLARNNHLDAFTESFSNGIETNINHALSNAPSVNTFQLDAGDSCGNFKPSSGEYIVSVWIKELLAPGTPYAGVSPMLIITHNGTSDTLKASGAEIDGWRKIEGSFTYDESQNLSIQFIGGIWGAFFDDFRIHRTSSNMLTYVYDRYSNRLVAQLDENNYAVFYEYDKAGIPAQVKKETDQGILTVSESRQSLHKK